MIQSVLKAPHFRKRAESLRVVARATADAAAREEFIRLAAHWDRIADDAEQGQAKPGSLARKTA